MTTDLDALLRAVDPAADVQDYDAGRARHVLVSATAASSSTQVVPLRTPYLRRTGVRVAIAATAAAAVLVLPVVSLRSGGAASPAAAAVLSRAASIGATDAIARGDQWFEVTTRGTRLTLTQSVESGGASAYLVPVTRVEWIAVDGSRPSWVRETGGAPRLVAGAPSPDSLVPVDSTSTSNVAPDELRGSWQAPSPDFLAAVPRDVDALRDRLYADTAGQGSSADGEVLVAVADVLRSGLVPADLRSALYRVLETVPGVEVTTASVAVGGATGVGLGRLEAVNGIRQEIVIDPTTGQVLAEREIAVREVDGIPAGTVIGQTTVTRAVVDAVPASVRATARHDDCTVQPDGGVTCR